ncbi:hypothetical protein [Rhizobium jaguaris]|uniref:Uncharacterized protein n=1 Tax=Rhizobium jaguaris TaxID=1312183 RepID=A0A387FV13_9HYPH|nr:hypothetical protein [Rhizobium jaguaris]AYG59681.1 hypothetical protein CCGE525_13375 [Rhizobium jaguaris]
MTPNEFEKIAATSPLYSDPVTFNFATDVNAKNAGKDDKKNPKDNGVTLTFLAGPDDEKGIFLQRPRSGQLNYQVELRANFGKRVFIRTVHCKNPVRLGNDIIAISAVDLVKRRLTWEPEGGADDLERTLDSFEMIFSYDFGSDEMNTHLEGGRMIDTRGHSFIEIKPEHIGLKPLFDN